MKIAEGTVVTLAYDITSQSGEIIETSDISGPITFMAGKSSLIRGLDERLSGMQAGQEEVFTFSPEEAFGSIEEAPSKTMTRAELPGELKKGTAFEATVEGGQTIKLLVHDLPDDDTVVVKLVHPLAGQEIGMSVKVLGVRLATAAEKQAGKAMTAPPPPPPPAKA